MSEETYNGWSDWNAWNVNLWLTNTPALNHMLHDVNVSLGTGPAAANRLQVELAYLGITRTPDGVEYTRERLQESLEAMGHQRKNRKAGKLPTNRYTDILGG